VLATLKVDAAQGLSDSEVEKRRAEYGTNELDKEEGTPLWKLVLAQFDDLLVKILLGAAVLSFVRCRRQRKRAALRRSSLLEPSWPPAPRACEGRSSCASRWRRRRRQSCCSGGC